MELKETIGKVEFLLRTRNYTTEEKETLIRLVIGTNENLRYDLDKFQSRWRITHFGEVKSEGWSFVIPIYEEDLYVM